MGAKYLATGFVLLCETLKKKGIDVPVYVTYYKKAEKVYVIDKPVMYSEITKNNPTKEEVAERLKNRCNELGQMSFEKEFIEKTKKENKLDK